MSRERKCIMHQCESAIEAMVARSCVRAGISSLAIEHQKNSAMHASAASMILDSLVWGNTIPAEVFV